jgi:N-acetylmuramoyl-L-alanine amidase
MKFVFLATLLAGVTAVGTVRADFINGHNYVALSAWAHTNGFHGYTLNQGTEFVLTNKIFRLVFNKDSADASINGIDVRLSFPVAKGGFISQLDADTTIRPLIYPPKSSAKRIITICIDPGHGGKDSGNRIGRIFPQSEKNLTLALGLELQRQLLQAGYNVLLTRDRDVYPELLARPDMANRHHADLFISLHFNSAPLNPASVQGPETYCITPVGAASSNDTEVGSGGHGASIANRWQGKSLLLAYEVQRSLVHSLGVTDRGVRRARFGVLRAAQMPAILVEGGYMSHPVEGRRILNADWRQQMAAAIVRGIMNYQKLTALPTPLTPSMNWK